MARGAEQIRWILFDLGDVIVDYQPRGVSHMARDLGVGGKVVDAALASDLVEEACTGALSPPDLAARLSQQLGVMISGEDMARWFAADVATVFPELVPCLEILSWHYQLGILSNTFFAHWDAFLELPVAGLFEQKMASHLLGLLKPDERIYRAALTRMDTQPEHVLFIDDKLENVEAARAIGMDAFQSTSPAETIRGLEQREILPTFAPPPAVTRERFLEWRSPRCSTQGPEVMNNPVWEWLVRTRLDAYTANRMFRGPDAGEAGPGWCCDRFGQSRTALPDGREVLIAGEHEDHYDADFHIYNDVIVLHPNGRIDILGYPEDVFPPTDFHSATLAGERIVLIGSLGHPERRRPGETQVMLLDTRTFAVAAQPTSGDGPGWIHDHEAALSEDGRAITIRGGRFVPEDDPGALLENFDDWRLDLDTWTWARLTERPWQRWELRREDGQANGLWEMRTALFDQEYGLGLEDLEIDGAPDIELPPLCPPSDPDLLRGLYEPELPHRVLPEREDEHNVFRIEVLGVTVRFVEGMSDVMMIFEGVLPPDVVERLVHELRDKLSRLEGTAWTARRR